jgi:hypothetical protein
LLLDVDGPLNPYGAQPDRPDGYRTYRETLDGGWVSDDWVHDGRVHDGRVGDGLVHDGRVSDGLVRGGSVQDDGLGHRVWLHPGHGSLLRGLAAETGLELVWATAWQHAANERVAPAIGLEPLPVIEFPARDVEIDADGRLRWRVGGGWKWPAVVEYAAGRPLAWLDDELNGGGFEVARAAFERDRAGSPTLLCHVDPRFGLQGAHLEEIRSWAAGLS